MKKNNRGCHYGIYKKTTLGKLLKDLIYQLDNLRHLKQQELGKLPIPEDLLTMEAVSLTLPL